GVQTCALPILEREPIGTKGGSTPTKRSTIDVAENKAEGGNLPPSTHFSQPIVHALWRNTCSMISRSISSFKRFTWPWSKNRSIKTQNPTMKRNTNPTKKIAVTTQRRKSTS